MRESTANRNRTTTKELAMNLPGLITVHPDQTDELDALAAMVGTCFREEMWYATWLDVPNISEGRKLAITQAVIRADYAVTAPYGCVFTLDDRAGAVNAFLRSELQMCIRDRPGPMGRRTLSQEAKLRAFRRWERVAGCSGERNPPARVRVLADSPLLCYK